MESPLPEDDYGTIPVPPPPEIVTPSKEPSILDPDFSPSPSPTPGLGEYIESLGITEEQKSKGLELVIMIVVMFVVTRFVSPDLSIMIKRTTFFLFTSYILLSAYVSNIQKMKGSNNLVKQVELLSKEVSDFITNGQHLIKHKSLEEFMFAIMDKHRHIFAMWMCFEDDNKDSQFAYRNMGKSMTMNVISNDKYKNHKKLQWYKKGVIMAEQGAYSKGVWVDPFVEDKITKTILFPCVYPLVTKDSFLDGVMCICFTLYKYNPPKKLTKNSMSKMEKKLNNPSI